MRAICAAPTARPSRSPAPGPRLLSSATGTPLPPHPSRSPGPIVDLATAVMQEQEAELAARLAKAGAQAKRAPVKARSASPAPLAARLTSPTQAVPRGQRGGPLDQGQLAGAGPSPRTEELQARAALYRGSQGRAPVEASLAAEGHATEACNAFIQNFNWAKSRSVSYGEWTLDCAPVPARHPVTCSPGKLAA